MNGARPAARKTARSAAPMRPVRGFGSIFRMSVKPGMKEQLKQTMMADPTSVPGMVAAHLFDTGGDEVWGVAIFRNEKTYRDNANSPGQNQRYQRFRALLSADPEWHDGTILTRPQ
jgi:hypothetical protein